MLSSVSDVPPEVAVAAFAHVLVPLDGSSFAAAALPTGHALAARVGATLRMISVARDERTAEVLRSEAAESVHDHVDPASVDVTVAHDPAAAIVAHANDLGSCVVCMST